MACCKCCCGNADCAEGQEGKCCCGGSSGTCCQTNEYCCSGVCQEWPCACCVKDGVTVSGVTTQEECEACLQPGLCILVQAEQNGVCPDGWTPDGNGACTLEQSVENCDLCEGFCIAEGDPVGACGTWQEPCEFCGDCVPYVTESENTEGGGGSCDRLRRNLQTITVPTSCPSPVWVKITGTVDDDIAIDDEIVGPGCRTAGAIDHEFSTSASSFTIETVDNVEGSISADLNICFYPEEPPP